MHISRVADTHLSLQPAQVAFTNVYQDSRYRDGRAQLRGSGGRLISRQALERAIESGGNGRSSFCIEDLIQARQAIVSVGGYAETFNIADNIPHDLVLPPSDTPYIDMDKVGETAVSLDFDYTIITPQDETAGAMRHYLVHSRGMSLTDERMSVMAPVSVRHDNERGDLGNRVSAWTLFLPIAEPDPLERLADIRRQTEDLKSSKRAEAAEMLTQATEWTGSMILSLGARLANLGTPFNMVVTNVPGPRVPLYLLESRLLEIHPHVPLMGLLGLGIALFSYDGTLSWGFSADWDLVPDLHDLIVATEASFAELREAAGVG